MYSGTYFLISLCILEGLPLEVRPVQEYNFNFQDRQENIVCIKQIHSSTTKSLQYIVIIIFLIFKN